MRKLIFLSAMLLTTLVAMAQHEEGELLLQPRVGMSIATLSDADKAITDLHLGLEAEFMVAGQFSLSAGILASNQGAKYDYVDNEGPQKYTVDLDYVQVPLLASYYVLPGLAVKAGVQPGFRMRAKLKDDDHTYDLDQGLKLLNHVENADYKINKFDLSIPVGLSYEYRNIVLDARYNFGLLKVANEGDAFYNRVFMLTLGYKIGIGN